MKPALEKLKQAWSLAGERYSKAFRRAYPVGSCVAWEKCGHIQQGEVLAHGYQDSLRVRNFSTGKDYMIDGYWLRP